MLFDQVGQAHENVNVGFNDLYDARSTDFKDNFFTTFQFATMNLGDTGCSKRFCGKFCKKFFCRVTQLPLDLGVNLFKGNRRNFVLKFTEFKNVRFVQYIGAGREELAELDKGRSELLHHQAQTLWLTETLKVLRNLVEGDKAFAEFEVVVDIKLFDKMSKAVLDQNPQNGSVASDGPDISVNAQDGQHIDFSSVQN